MKNKLPRDLYYDIFKSPLGELLVAAKKETLFYVGFDNEPVFLSWKKDHSEVASFIKQLKGYFDRKVKQFDMNWQFVGTEFQKKVLHILSKVPYGETISYQQLAMKAGNPKAVRAVGRCNAENTISIVIPCHRVIGKDGSLVGYGGGLDRKEYLLNMENSKRKANA